MEATLDIELYETLRDPLTDSGAKVFVRLLDAKLEQVFENKKDVLATKHDVAMIKSDITELRIATLRDLSSLRTEMKQDVASLEVKLAQSKADLIKWMFIFLIGQAAAIISVIKLL